MTYAVFVDGPRDRSPAAIKRVAAAIAQRYGLPPAELEARLARGRFKVKAGVDRATAETYARDLERLGAICVVLDGSGATVDLGGAPASAAAAHAAAAPPAAAPRTSSLPPPATARAQGSSLPARTTAPPARPASGALGLAGAKPGTDADLGALGRDDGAIALSSLDGEAEPVIEPTSLAASFGPAPARAPTPAPSERPPTSPGGDAAAARAMTGPPVDLFAAPDAEADAEVELALDVVPRRPATPPPVAVEPPPAVIDAGPAPAFASAPPAPSPVARIRELLANARHRFAAGVIIAVLIGFVPAHIVASVRERSAYAEIDRNLRKHYADFADDEAELAKARASALDSKYGERRSIALSALAVWAVVGAGLAYVWFRRVPWDRVAIPRG